LGDFEPQLDARFRLPFVHRLRFTRGAFDVGNDAIVSLLEPSTPGEEARVLAILDEGVAEAWPSLDAAIGAWAGREAVALAGPTLVAPGGERVKNEPEHLERMLDAIHGAKLCRRSYVMAIGGGAVLDAAGYASAIAHRGVRLVRLPTTTLAQDDSGVGVKNGVNRYGKKNYLGTFAVPWAVVCDEAFLETLSDRDWRCGMAEAVKVGLVKDASLFEQVEREAERLAERDADAARPIIQRSAELHLRHITEGGDPFELTAARPLDFGHWAAHRLEHLSGYRVRHGEAVAIGVALDSEYSRLAGWLDGVLAPRGVARRGRRAADRRVPASRGVRALG